jgi:hypothetical protein
MSRQITLMLLAFVFAAPANSLLSSPTAAGRLRGPCKFGRPIIARSRPIIADGISQSLAEKLRKVRDLRPTAQSPDMQASLWKAAGLDPTFKVSGIMTGEPSFTRLFSHDTWQQYTGKSPFRRWLRITATWRFSTVLAAVWPIILLFTTWAFAIASLPKTLLPRVSPIPLTLMGSAIGLLLVFRTNNTYQRLNEARILWGRAVFLCREIAQSTATALFFDETIPDRAVARQAAGRICCLLAAWAWELYPVALCIERLCGPRRLKERAGSFGSLTSLPLTQRNARARVHRVACALRLCHAGTPSSRARRASARRCCTLTTCSRSCCPKRRRRGSATRARAPFSSSA